MRLTLPSTISTGYLKVYAEESENPSPPPLYLRPAYTPTDAKQILLFASPELYPLHAKGPEGSRSHAHRKGIASVDPSVSPNVGRRGQGPPLSPTRVTLAGVALP